MDSKMKRVPFELLDVNKRAEMVNKKRVFKKVWDSTWEKIWARQRRVIVYDILRYRGHTSSLGQLI
jgi:hypothetical protein